METLEADVGKLEAELQRCAPSWPAITPGDWQKLHTLADRERELDALLARRMAEWEAASAALAKAGVCAECGTYAVDETFAAIAATQRRTRSRPLAHRLPIDPRLT